MVLELRDGDADEGAGGGDVEEAGVAAVRGVARVLAEALGEEHPAPRVEARIQQAAAARGGGGGAPAGADRAEADVVQETPRGEHPRGDELCHVDVQRRPARHRLLAAAAAAPVGGGPLPQCSGGHLCCPPKKPRQDYGGEEKQIKQLTVIQVLLEIEE